jgi:hypothetical protein
VLFFGAFFLFYRRFDVSSWGEVSDSFWTPIPLFEILHLSAFSSLLLIVCQGVWKISLALSCLGLFTRTSTVSSFVLGIYLLGLPHNFGKTNHYDALVVLILGLMAASKCGDACSIDRLIWKVRHRSDRSLQRPRMSGEYTWPVRAVWLLFALIFFAAGVSKLRHSGLEWIFSDNMATLLLKYSFENNPIVTWGAVLAQYPWLTQLMAASTIALEVSYPLALFSRRARWIIVPGVFSMQVGIKLFMGISFDQFLICNLFWIPWDRISHGSVRGFHKLLSLGERFRLYDRKSPKEPYD